MTLSDYIKVLQSLEVDHGWKEVYLTVNAYWFPYMTTDVLYQEPECLDTIIVLGDSD